MSTLTGKGIIFPVELSGGAPVVQSGDELIKSSIKMILGWSYGNRYMLPEFGSRLEELLEEPNDESLKALVEFYIYDAIRTWESRITMNRTTVQVINYRKLEVFITYTIKENNQQSTLIYPFYKDRLI